GYERFRGRVGESAAVLAELAEFDVQFSRDGERLRSYASLKAAEDETNSDYQRMNGRLHHARATAAEAGSFVRPEIMAIPEEKIASYLESPELAEWKVMLERGLRYRPHTLSDKEERLLAMQGQMSGAAGHIFSQLNDA